MGWCQFYRARPTVVSPVLPRLTTSAAFSSLECHRPKLFRRRPAGTRPLVDPSFLVRTGRCRGAWLEATCPRDSGWALANDNQMLTLQMLRATKTNVNTTASHRNCSLKANNTPMSGGLTCSARPLRSPSRIHPYPADVRTDGQTVSLRGTDPSNPPSGPTILPPRCLR